MGTAKNEFFRLPRKPENAHFIRVFGDAEKFFCTYLTQSDDLGRVVIPKEIRRTLRIREGTPLEIFTDREGEIILKKYSPIGELGAFAGQYAESLAQTTGLTVCVCDRDQVIAVSGGSRKELLGKNISRQLETVIEARENFLVDNKAYKYMQITDHDREDFTGEAVSPILCEGDAIGAVVILSREPKQLLGETEQKLAISAAGFLGKQMEQ